MKAKLSCLANGRAARTGAACKAPQRPGKPVPRRPLGKTRIFGVSNVDAQQVFTIGQNGLYMLLMISAPILLAVLAVGLVISVFQAATQINEQTLSFVPKVLAAVAVLAIAGPWMMTMLVDYIRQTLTSI